VVLKTRLFLSLVYQVYLFSGGKLKVADKRFNTLKNNYEITFDATSDIRPVADDAGIKQMSFSFIKISQLPDTAVNTMVDILGQ